MAMELSRGCCLMASILTMVVSMPRWVNGAEQVPCYYIFGDSLWDNGNNNALSTKAKANYPPYGVDFPGGQPTGRFTNGLTMADALAQLLGFAHFMPSFASNANDEEILKGVNYASGGAGIRGETAQKNLGAVVSMDMQLQNHKNIASRIEKKLGSAGAAANHLRKCLYTVGIGSNDYINNYLLPNFYNTKTLYTPEQYAAILAEQFLLQLKTLHSLGGRKVAIFGVGLIGCTPGSIATYGSTNNSSCVDDINNQVRLFNAKLVSLVDELNHSHRDAKFIYVDIFGISGNPSPMPPPCCEVGNLKENNGVLTCTPSGKYCPDRSKKISWDGTHPTEVVNRLIAKRTYDAQKPSDTHPPIDIHRLVMLNLPTN